MFTIITLTLEFFVYRHIGDGFFELTHAYRCRWLGWIPPRSRAVYASIFFGLLRVGLVLWTHPNLWIVLRKNH